MWSRTSNFITGKPDYMYHYGFKFNHDMIITHLLFKNTIHEFLYLWSMWVSIHTFCTAVYLTGVRLMIFLLLILLWDIVMLGWVKRFKVYKFWLVQLVFSWQFVISFFKHWQNNIWLATDVQFRNSIVNLQLMLLCSFILTWFLIKVHWLHEAYGIIAKELSKTAGYLLWGVVGIKRCHKLACDHQLTLVTFITFHLTYHNFSINRICCLHSLKSIASVGMQHLPQFF